MLRPYPPADLFRPDPPLLAGTPAEHGTDAVVKYISHATGAALQVKPDLAVAYFLRGWAIYLRDSSSAWAIADIERAAQIDPDEPLYAQSVVYLER